MVDLVEMGTFGIKPGKRANGESGDAYGNIAAVNWSTLSPLATSPKLCRYRADNPRKDTEALRGGHALHVRTLEPERWARTYFVEPDFGPQYTAKGDLATNPKATKGYKEALAAWKETLPPGAEIIDPDDYALTVQIAENIRKHRIAGPLLTGGKAEHVITWTDEATGVKCKARLDHARNSVIELKSTSKDSIHGFTSDVARYRYFGQVAFYHDGAIASGTIPADADGPFIIAAQTCEPYDVIPFRVIPETLEIGRSLYRQLLERYMQCQQADWWPGLGEDFVPLILPRWADGAREFYEVDGDPW